MNAALISGFVIGITGAVLQNAWYYWHRKPLLWLAAVLEIGGSLLLGWGADMAHRSIIVVAAAAAFVLSVAGSAAFIAFMAEVRHQGWVPVVKRMSERHRKS